MENRYSGREQSSCTKCNYFSKVITYLRPGSRQRENVVEANKREENLQIITGKNRIDENV